MKYNKIINRLIFSKQTLSIIKNLNLKKMSKHTTPLIFNFSAKNKTKSTPSKKSLIFPTQDENQPPQFYTRNKRNFAEMLEVPKTLSRIEIS